MDRKGLVGHHVVVRHIRVNLFTVLLLFRLDVVEHLSCLRVGEFKYAGVVQRGSVLFCSQHVLAEKCVVFLFVLVRVVGASAVAVIAGDLASGEADAD